MPNFNGLVVALGSYRPVDTHEWDLFANESSLTVHTSNFTSGVKLIGTGVTLSHCDMRSVLLLTSTKAALSHCDARNDVIARESNLMIDSSNFTSGLELTGTEAALDHCQVSMENSNQSGCVVLSSKSRIHAVQSAFLQCPFTRIDNDVYLLAQNSQFNPPLLQYAWATTTNLLCSSDSQCPTTTKQYTLIPNQWLSCVDGAKRAFILGSKDASFCAVIDDAEANRRFKKLCSILQKSTTIRNTKNPGAKLASFSKHPMPESIHIELDTAHVNTASYELKLTPEKCIRTERMQPPSKVHVLVCCIDVSCMICVVQLGMELTEVGAYDIELLEDSHGNWTGRSCSLVTNFSIFCKVRHVIIKCLKMF